MPSTNFCNTTRISIGCQWFLGMAMGGAIALCANCVSAQIIPDGTLPNNSIVPLNCTNCEITGGTKVGENLFHSFTEFSVPTGGTAYFNNTVDIQNIISRVTGKSVSSIDGLIRANHTANLFILNPNGIIFGQNAQLNIGGSFVASTANSFRFSDGSEFSAINPQVPPLLVVNIIPGLQYGLTQAESQISNAGQLAVAESKSLILHSGTVTSTGSLIAPSGTITLEAEGNISTGGILTGSSPELTFIQSGGAISLISHDGEINTTAGVLNSGSLVNGGAITLQAEGNITTGNILSAIIPRENDDSLTSLTQNGGAISLISHDGEINTTAGVLNSGSLVNGGAVNLQAKGNIITGDILTSIPTKSPPFTFTQNGGAISLISRDGEINTTAGSLISRADNQGGTIFLNAQGNIGIFILDTSANKLGGNIDIISNDARVYTKADSGIISEIQGNSKTPDSSKGGDINITARSLVIQDGTRVSASTRGPGTGGNLTIHTTDFVEISGVSPSPTKSDNNSGLFTLVVNSPSSEVIATGKGGNLSITTERLLVEGGGQISTAASPGTTGNAGDLTITASEVKVSGVATSSYKGDYPTSALASATQGEGKGGNLVIHTKRLIIEGGATVVSASGYIGDAGNLIIDAPEFVEITGAGGSADNRFVSALSVDTVGFGKVGNLTLKTGKLILSNGGAISASTAGANPGGDISIEATNSIQVSGTDMNNGFASGVYAQTFADGKAGNVKIETGELTVSDRATITVASRSTTDTQVPSGVLKLLRSPNSNTLASIVNNNTLGGDAGNLDITANSIRLNNKASISAITASGNGGNVTLNLKDLLLLRSNSQISTSAGTKLTGGNGGNITINSRNSPSGFIVAVPNEHSNITANAFNDKGGRVEIDVTRIFGLKVLSREDLIRLSGKNDLTQLNLQQLQQFPSSITAISQTKPDLDGQIILKIPDTDPSRGLVQLPINLVDASQKIDTGCNVGGKQRKSSFVITGRGGLPAQPGEALRTESVIVNGVAGEQNPSASGNFTPDSTSRIVEAQGWVVNSLGEITLTAYPTSVTPSQNFRSTPATCHAS